eukprot:Pgem_evm1s16762
MTCLTQGIDIRLMYHYDSATFASTYDEANKSKRKRSSKSNRNVSNTDYSIDISRRTSNTYHTTRRGSELEEGKLTNITSMEIMEGIDEGKIDEYDDTVLVNDEIEEKEEEEEEEEEKEEEKTDYIYDG